MDNILYIIGFIGMLIIASTGLVLEKRRQFKYGNGFKRILRSQGTYLTNLSKKEIVDYLSSKNINDIFGYDIRIENSYLVIIFKKLLRENSICRNMDCKIVIQDEETLRKITITNLDNNFKTTPYWDFMDEFMYKKLNAKRIV